jgi:hypothetical protein
MIVVSIVVLATVCIDVWEYSPYIWGTGGAMGDVQEETPAPFVVIYCPFVPSTVGNKYE